VISGGSALVSVFRRLRIVVVIIYILIFDIFIECFPIMTITSC